MNKSKQSPSVNWLKSMIKDEKEGIKEYSGKTGFGEQVKQEKQHLKKLEDKLKRVKR